MGVRIARLGSAGAVNAGGSVFVTWQWPHKGTFYPRVAFLTAAHHWRRPRTVTLRSSPAMGWANAAVIWHQGSNTKPKTDNRARTLGPCR